MAKARLYFDGDNSWIEKEARTYSLTQEVEDKLDSISDFQNDIDDLQDQINNLAQRGRYLSTWNCVTWLPDTNPQVDPYVYRAWDYYIVSTVWWRNLRPSGSEYHQWVASQALETETVTQNDLYIYDWIQWIRQWSWSAAAITWGSIVWTLSNQTDLQNALNGKANVSDVNTKTFFMTSQNYFTKANEVYDWYVAWNNPIIIYDGETYIFDWYQISADPTIAFMYFYSKLLNSSATDSTWTQMKRKSVRIEITNWQIVDVYFNSSASVWPKFLSTNNFSSTPFTPTHASHPATKKYVDDAVAWAWQVQVSSQTGNILTSWMKIWAWTESDYSSLSSYDSNTLYLTV